MELAGLSVLGFSIAQVTGESVASLAQELPTGVLGNFAHELTKISFRSVVERARRGELAPNHDLQRAARRAYISATLVAVLHYRHTQDGKQGKEIWRDWADTLAGYLREEIQWTQEAGYTPPKSAADNRYDQLLSSVESASEPGAELQSVLIGELLAELRGWHGREWAPDHPGFPEPSAVFEGWLKDGWPYVELPVSFIVGIARIFQRRRGRSSNMVRRT